MTFENVEIGIQSFLNKKPFTITNAIYLKISMPQVMLSATITIN